jgi:hypothetical protein
MFLDFLISQWLIGKLKFNWLIEKTLKDQESYKKWLISKKDRKTTADIVRKLNWEDSRQDTSAQLGSNIESGT